MARCRCLEGTCGCSLRGGVNVTIGGTGTAADPWVVHFAQQAIGTILVEDTPSVDMIAAGGGTEPDPYRISAKANLAPLISFSDTDEVAFVVDGDGTEDSPYNVTATLPQIDFAVGVPGDLVLTQQPDGTFAPAVGGGGAGGGMTFADTPEVDFTTAGTGTIADPIVVTATLPLVDFTGGNPGDVLTQQADGTFYPGPPTQAPAGSVATGFGISGDGTGANPFRINLCTYDELKAACAP